MTIAIQPAVTVVQHIASLKLFTNVQENQVFVALDAGMEEYSPLMKNVMTLIQTMETGVLINVYLKLVLHVTIPQRLLQFAQQLVEIAQSLDLKIVTMEMLVQETDAQVNADRNNIGLVLELEQVAVSLLVETEEFEEMNNVTMAMSEILMVAAVSVR